MTPETIAALQAIGPLSVQTILLLGFGLLVRGNLRLPREVTALEKQLKASEDRSAKYEEMAWKAVSSGRVLAEVVKKKDEDA